ncbi:hypothetical protein NOJ28_11170 [Neorhizobium galegae]|uniref:hypothetical protein n=1 Tax=Neorhizobium galegae TaxID=399 RepID=UPI0021020F62|nr:hypothetical protein [Neorhizobium galegae]MCQ1766096.1 hypothetical protein [Neorhizobium galegae]MCQ1845010.1 hypothetical protein [Neorhizobium galegae]
MSDHVTYSDPVIRSWVLNKFRRLGIIPGDLMVENAVRKLRRLPEEQWDAGFETAIKVDDLKKFQEIEEAIRKQSESLEKLGNVLTLIVSLIALGSAFSTLGGLGYNFFPSATDILQWLVEASPYLVTPLGVTAALILFVCRGYLPRFYGTLEVIVGIMTVNATAASVQLANMPSLIPFLGGIYVIIRGLDNVAKTLDPDQGVGIIFSKAFNNPPAKT